MPETFPFLDSEQARRLRGFFDRRAAVSLSLPEGGALAYVALALFDVQPGHWVWVAGDPLAAETLLADLHALDAGERVRPLSYPAWDLLPAHGLVAPPEVVGERLQTLGMLGRDDECRLVVTTIQALLQRTLSTAELKARSARLMVGDELDPQAMAEQLLDWGYDLLHQVDQAGQASLRGGLLDVWPVTSEWPVRIEFFGNSIDSLRTFDPVDQTSVQRIHSFELAPSSEAHGISTSFFDHVPEQAHWGLIGSDGLIEQGRRYEATLAELAEPPLHGSLEETLRVLRERGGARVFAGEQPADWQGVPVEPVDLGFEAVDSLPNLEADLFHPDVMEKHRVRYLADLFERAGSGEEVRLFFDSEGVLERFRERYAQAGEALPFDLVARALSGGFSLVWRRLRVVTESDVYGYRKQRRPRRKTRAASVPRPSQTLELASWTELVPGELVVHAEHGLGKYLGLYEILFDGQIQEVLAIEYAESAKLYVPPSQAHLLSRYMGVGQVRPSLSRLGGSRWKRQKEAVCRAVEDLAAQLLETQAARESLHGHAFKSDTTWQHEFEQSFPYEETEDQAEAVAAVKRDMESARPMDRLICGDVGYGKTEVAMRAAFKAVMDGRQVAVLVPTTVLAQQHFYTFSERMAAFPVTVEMLSRFRTRGEQRDVIERLKSGAVDIVIGTHRLVQADVQFRNLGLVVIDEEQRFGVAHKERLKRLRHLVDVLTLTATPIPRTLYMSLTGARDMSTIQTPPRERLAIETVVTQDDDQTIRAAILHEMSRQGQVFFLHNRVQSIQVMLRRLQRIVPEAWISMAHGQMSENRLASIMRKFAEGRFHVLLCTTIIESGVDIPNVNTIIIDRADRFGLAELYQLRGRVGRSRNKAYAYLLVPGPRGLQDDARRRIQAIKHYSALGAGFKVALRDLEIRGAGNLLGSQQSGHIAAVGFDLYCQLLRRSIAVRQGERPPPLVHVDVHLDFIELSPRLSDSGCAVAIPYDYVEEEGQRVELYRRLASCTEVGEVRALREMMRDRFGALPPPAERMLLLAVLRIEAAQRHVQRVVVREGRIMLTRHDELLMEQHRFPSLVADESTGRIAELIEHVRALAP